MLASLSELFSRLTRPHRVGRRPITLKVRLSPPRRMLYASLGDPIVRTQRGHAAFGDDGAPPIAPVTASTPGDPEANVAQVERADDDLDFHRRSLRCVGDPDGAIGGVRCNGLRCGRERDWQCNAGCCDREQFQSWRRDVTHKCLHDHLAWLRQSTRAPDPQRIERKGCRQRAYIHCPG